MSRFRAATSTNRVAGRDIERETLRRIRNRANAAAVALKQANGADPETVLAKLTEVNSAYAEIDALVLELAGAALLGGRSAAEVSAATGISTATLTRRVPRALTGLRGHALVRDPRATYGWRTAA